jgi:putative sugar O-methyltransferase
MRSTNNFIEKIIKNYSQVKDPSNSRSLHWSKFAKKSESLKIDDEQLENFRANLSLGRDDAHGRLHYLTDEYIKTWEDLLGKNYLKSNLPSVNIGNSRDIREINGKVYDVNSFFAVYYLQKIQSTIPNLKGLKVWEIGGGYGALAQCIINSCDKNIKYFFTDLPEANLQAAYFLKMHFKDLRIAVDSDFLGNKIPVSALNEYDVFIINPNIQFCDELKFDLVINTRSMMEMETVVIKSYFDNINRLIKDNGVFFCVNRYWKSSVGQDIKLIDFPFDNQWLALISESCQIQPHIHIFSLRRVICGGDIKSVLNDLKTITTKFTPPLYKRINYRLQRILSQIFGYDIIFKLKNLFSFS